MARAAAPVSFMPKLIHPAAPHRTRGAGQLFLAVSALVSEERVPGRGFPLLPAGISPLQAPVLPGLAGGGGVGEGRSGLSAGQGILRALHLHHPPHHRA